MPVRHEGTDVSRRRVIRSLYEIDCFPGTFPSWESVRPRFPPVPAGDLSQGLI